MEGERRRRRVAVPTCLLLSLLCGWWLGAARTGSLSVVSGLLSVIFGPGGTVVWLGARGRSWTPSSGHLSLLLVVFLPGLRVVLLRWRSRLLGLLANLLVIFFPRLSVVRLAGGRGLRRLALGRRGRRRWCRARHGTRGLLVVV